MTAVQAYLADVGIKMEFELVEGDLATILWTAPADQTNGPRAVDWDICYAANAASPFMSITTATVPALPPTLTRQRTPSLTA